jgi:hypothetical protein
VGGRRVRTPLPRPLGPNSGNLRVMRHKRQKDDENFQFKKTEMDEHREARICTARTAKPTARYGSRQTKGHMFIGKEESGSHFTAMRTPPIANLRGRNCRPPEYSAAGSGR